ncbi:MAG: phytanoyl-CoA dioxygenase family protein [Rhodospirillales bacterium]|nr:phytanoyl-CoA dioxygenase family protein [Rhodospirillales bacterium]
MPEFLTEDQIDQFRRDGFLTPFDGVTPAVARDCVDRIEAYEARVGEDVSRQIRVRAALAFEWVVAIARSPNVIGAMRDLMGPDIMIYLSAIWSKRPGGGAFVSWHQDGAYYAFDRHDGLTVWVALTDATPEMGCITVLPGSHLDPIRAHDETFDSDNLLSRGQSITGIDKSNAVEMPLTAGQFSIHHELAVHGSGPNLSDLRRIGFSLSCVPAGTRVVEGPRSGVLVCGDPGHWETDPEPRFDFDPVSMAALENVQTAYRDPAFRNEVERRAAERR